MYLNDLIILTVNFKPVFSSNHSTQKLCPSLRKISLGHTVSMYTAVYIVECHGYGSPHLQLRLLATAAAACEKWPQGLHTHYTNSDINLK